MKKERKYTFESVDSDDNFTLFIQKIKSSGKLVCKNGFFEDIETGENLGKEVIKEDVLYDDNHKLLVPYKSRKVRWIRDESK